MIEARTIRGLISWIRAQESPIRSSAPGARAVAGAAPPALGAPCGADPAVYGVCTACVRGVPPPFCGATPPDGGGGGSGRIGAFVSAMGSAGTLAAADGIKAVQPLAQAVAVEPIQCPTLWNCGYGAHRIEGIGDKHVTWIHHVMATDHLVCIDDAARLAGGGYERRTGRDA